MSGMPHQKTETCRTCPEPITTARAAGNGLCKRCYMRGWNRANQRSDYSPVRARAWSLMNKYQITPEVYDAQEAHQHGLCAICGFEQVIADGRRMAVDHDHKCCPGGRACGECLRGLLCSNCNQLLGKAKDDIRLLARAIAYLDGGGVWNTIQKAGLA